MFRINPRSLTFQMIAGFVAVVLLTATAAWFPEIWLIRDQLDAQAWDQVNQGRRTTRALYRSWQSEVENSAILAAQLPSLPQLLETGTGEQLLTYLRNLEVGLDLDVVAICGPDKQVLAKVSEVSPIASQAVCTSSSSGFWIAGVPAASAQVWLLGTHVIESDSGPLGSVITGILLDDQFAAEMSTQTGLEHTLLVDGQPVATSFPAETRTGTDTGARDSSRIAFEVGGNPYYATRLTVHEPRVADEIALSVTGIAATKRRLFGTVTISVLIVAALGSLAGVMLARRVGRPLIKLAEAASAISSGDLASSIDVDAGVEETALVAQALEQARVDLRRTLADLQQEKAWRDHLLESIVEGIMILDEGNRITFFSRGAERISGWKEESVLGKSCDDIFETVETPEPFSALIPPAGRQQRITVALNEGRQATLSITRAELVPPDSGQAQAALVFRDVTEADAIQRLLGNFLANMTHEFRTPLSALEASTELLRDQGSDLSPEELDRLLVSQHLGIVGLQRLVDNLLESASLEAGRFRVSPRPIDVREVISEAGRMMRPLLAKYDQRLVVQIPDDTPIISADPQRTVQVLVNLLSNASKYGPEDAQITIGASVQDGQVRITVTDQGPGIAPAHREELFRRFTHFGPDDNTAQYGAGLGLWVVKAIVEAHGGDVGVEERPDCGSTFWFTLPAAEEQ